MARVVPLEGEFFARLRGWNRWQRFDTAASLRSGEELRVLDGARVEVQLPARGSLRTRGECFFLVRTSELLMDGGFADVRALDQESLLLVTPSGELAARRARFSVVVEETGTLARVLSGVVAVRGGPHGAERLAGTGLEALLRPGVVPSVRRAPGSVKRELVRFSDTGPAPAPSEEARSEEAGESPTGTAKASGKAAGAGQTSRAGRGGEQDARAGKPPTGGARSGADPGISASERAGGAGQPSLRDRMHGLRSPQERIRRYQMQLAQQAAAEREEFERALGEAGGKPTLLQLDARRRTACMQERRERSLARGELLASAHRAAQEYVADQSRDELLAARREAALGRSLWFQTRQGVLEARLELVRLGQTIDGLTAELATLGTPPANASRALELSRARDAAAARADRVKDRIGELIELQ